MSNPEPHGLPENEKETEEERKRRKRAEKRRKKLLARGEHGLKYIYNQIDKTELEKKTEENIKNAEKRIAMEAKTSIAPPQAHPTPNFTPNIRRSQSPTPSRAPMVEYVRIAVMCAFAILVIFIGELEPIAWIGSLENGALWYFTFLQLLFGLYIEILPRLRESKANKSGGHQENDISGVFQDNPLFSNIMGMSGGGPPGSNPFSRIKEYAMWGMAFFRMIKSWFNDLVIVIFVYGVVVALIIAYREMVGEELPLEDILKEEL